MSESRSPSRFGVGGVPEVHLHARTAAVGRRREVGVVRAAAILRFGVDGIVADAAVAEVVRLEVACGFVEAVAVELVVKTLFR